eukprot:SAG25_NODE_2211_length_1834_cov_56.045533_1_plen_31_part_10
MKHMTTTHMTTYALGTTQLHMTGQQTDIQTY